MKRIGVERSGPPSTTLFLLLTLLPVVLVDPMEGSRIPLYHTTKLHVGSWITLCHGILLDSMTQRVVGSMIQRISRQKCGPDFINA